MGGLSIRTILALLAILALSVPVAAEECVPTTSHPEVEAFGFYIDNDLCQFGPEEKSYGGGDGSCLFSIWTYEESNGIPGLQRGDEMVDDTCGGMIESDTLAFY